MRLESGALACRVSAVQSTATSAAASSLKRASVMAAARPEQCGADDGDVDGGAAEAA